jgi:uncharacterized protein
MDRQSEPSVTVEARAIIEALGLDPHPEGGYYRETFRASLELTTLPYIAPPASRSASTAIYFLLPAGSFSAFHRIKSDEVWHHYEGAALELHIIDERGMHRIIRLGSDILHGERPQAVVPAGMLQAARPSGDGHVLVGCTVAPGFDFADFEMPGRTELTREFPQHAKIISELTR